MPNNSQRSTYVRDFRGIGWLGAARLNDNEPAGLNEAGNWTWQSGNPWHFTDWKYGEPSNKTHRKIDVVSEKSTDYELIYRNGLGRLSYELNNTALSILKVFWF